MSGIRPPIHVTSPQTMPLTAISYRNPEWHANVFAAAFLMPTAAVRALVDRYGADPDAMAEIFGVSPRAAELRLHYMGLEVVTM